MGSHTFTVGEMPQGCDNTFLQGGNGFCQITPETELSWELKVYHCQKQK